MAASGVYTWSPTVASLADEISERSGVDPATLNHRHLTSLMTSFQFAMRELEAEDLSSFWRIDNESTTTTASVNTLSLASGTIDVMNVTISSDSGTTDVPLERAPREDAFHNADKSETGKPTYYWVNYESLSPVMTFWPVPDVSTYVIKYDRFRYSQDITALTETTDLQRFWIDAFTYNCAMRFSEKYNVERVARNEKRYYEMVEKAKGARVGRGPIIISARSFGRARTRRL